MTNWTGRERHGAPAGPSPRSVPDLPLAPVLPAVAGLPASAAGGADAVRGLLHDLRQPLAAIRMLSEGSDDVRLVAIHAQAQWLADLTEEVLGASRGAQAVLLRLYDVVQHVVARYDVTSPDVIELEPDRLAGQVIADRRALERALSCVLDNAVRAAGPDGRVEVSVQSVGGDVHVVVTDDGPGPGRISAHNGLGLTIARALLAAYGGGGTLQPGRHGGAVARFVLPAAQTSRAVAS